MSASKTIRVLIVDDFVTMRRIVRTIFESIGFHKIEEAEAPHNSPLGYENL